MEIQQNSTVLDKLYELALRVLSVLASRARVECVLSYGSLILQPHQPNLSDN